MTEIERLIVAAFGVPEPLVRSMTTRQGDPPGGDVTVMPYDRAQQADHLCQDPGGVRGFRMSGGRMAGTTTEQGYGWDHQRTRSRWAEVIKAEGGAECTATVCLMPTRWIQPDEPWDLGHEDGQRRHRGPEHRKCNRSDGAHKSNRTGNPGAKHRKPRRPRRRTDLVEVSVDVRDL